ncbi:MAG: hypothetical protein WCW32_03675 [Candidatus Paceibacterota bacterium]|jgi:hypothetical protein
MNARALPTNRTSRTLYVIGFIDYCLAIGMVISAIWVAMFYEPHVANCLTLCVGALVLWLSGFGTIMVSSRIKFQQVLYIPSKPRPSIVKLLLVIVATAILLAGLINLITFYYVTGNPLL